MYVRSYKLYSFIYSIKNKNVSRLIFLSLVKFSSSFAFFNFNFFNNALFSRSLYTKLIFKLVILSYFFSRFNSYSL